MAVVTRHGDLDPVRKPAFQGGGGAFADDLVQDALVIRKASQDIRGRIHLARWAADAEAQLSDVLGAQVLLDIAQPFLPAGAAARAQPQDAQGQIEMVANDQEPRRIDVVVAQQRAGGGAAAVHEQGGLGEQDVSRADGSAGDFRAPFAAPKIELVARCQLIQRLPTDVVARFGVFAARVAEADEEEPCSHAAKIAVSAPGVQGGSLALSGGSRHDKSHGEPTTALS